MIALLVGHDVVEEGRLRRGERRLQRRGLPAFQSWNAGTYLCNATLYGTLYTTGAQAIEAGFVHIPASLAPPGPFLALGGPLRTSAGCPLSWRQTLEGALEILATCLDRPAPGATRLASELPRLLTGQGRYG